MRISDNLTLVSTETQNIYNAMKVPSYYVHISSLWKTVTMVYMLFHGGRYYGVYTFLLLEIFWNIYFFIKGAIKNWIVVTFLPLLENWVQFGQIKLNNAQMPILMKWFAHLYSPLMVAEKNDVQLLQKVYIIIVSCIVILHVL